MIATFLVIAIALAASLAISFFFSGAETAIISADKFQLRHRRDQGDEGAASTLELLGNVPPLMSSVLIGTNLGNVFAALLFKLLLDQIWTFESAAFGPVAWPELITLAVLTPVIVVFAEILPKSLFRARSNQWIVPIRPALKLSMICFAPVIKLLNAIVVLFLIPFGGSSAGHRPGMTRSDLLAMLNSPKRPGNGDAEGEAPPEGAGSDGAEAAEEEAGVVEQVASIREPDERRLIHNIVGLESTHAREIMRPLAALEAVNLRRSTVETFLAQARGSGHSRFPVYQDRIINLIGYIDIYDVLRSTDEGKKLEDFIRPVHFIPETKRVDDLLEEFLAQRLNNAIVVDEYGGCSGWVTREDIIEEIVGEIEDELDRPTILVSEEGEGIYHIDGRSAIDDVNEVLGAAFDDGACDTLGGLMMKELGRMPRAGDVLQLEGWRFQILEMDNLRVARVEARRES